MTINGDNFKIRLAKEIDIPDVTKLVNAAYRELADMGLNYTATYQNDDKTKERISNGRCFVLIDDANRIIGTILITIENYFTNNNTAYLGQLGVLPEFKKKGLGTKLMEFCENLIKEEGFSGVQLDTAIPAKHLVEWYQRRGYQIVGQEHYEGKTYDSYVFEKIFIPDFPAIHFNNQLKEIPNNIKEFESYTEELKRFFSISCIYLKNIKILENLGVALRILNRLDESETYLSKALSLSANESVSKQVQNLIRLAHVYQWQRQFAKAKALFDQARSLINEFSISDTLRAAYHQHLGKLYFDQKLYGLSLIEFELAKKIRIQISAPKDQLESTEFSITKAKENGSLKIPEKFIIRRAEAKDAQEIHNAHMVSINEICSKDHTPEEIRVWGGRSFEQVNRIPAIQNQFYLVVEFNGKIEGFCQAKSFHSEQKNQIHLHGFYITPTILKKRIGHLLMNLVFEYAHSENIFLITLKSTLTSFEFYKKYGFVKTGELTGPIRDGVMIRGYPMEKRLTRAKLDLAHPSLTLYPQFLEFVEDMRSQNQTLWEPYLPKKEETPQEFVQRLRDREQKPEIPFVPETIYWAVFDGNVVGRISLRHRLEGNLHKVGGHIGYEVGPKWRQRGFATEMLRLVLDTPKAKEIGKVLLTCSPSNEASNKTILNNGGSFDKTIFVDFLNENRNHYWINIKN